ncbi:MAG TPA: flagellin [Lacipirellulaceae bacterium]|nr:flagellin [Lacipirellulaceae bacterium]
MSRIAPIPTTRVGNFFIRQRLVDQMQYDQRELLRLQMQISTGRRFQLASEDTPAAMRAINLQRVLDRKGQIQTNVHASNMFLGAAEAHLGDVSADIYRLRAEVLGVVGSVGTEQARQDLARSIGDYINQFMAAGNGKTLSRHLFSGSRQLIDPYTFDGEFVEYHGNEGTLRSWVDLGRLFDTSLTGSDVFGGISAPVQGSVDLNPQLTEDTLLGAINGGEGIARGGAVSIAINTGPTTVTNIVELDGAVTIGDVMRLIEAGAPSGTVVDVNIVGNGLEISTTSGTISVREVAEGRTAHELGVFTNPSLPPTTTVNGADLDPVLLKTTRLDELLGGALDTTSGIIVTNGGNSATLDISAAETVDDLLNLFNGAGLGLLAEINDAGAGINVRSRLSGADLTIGENGGTTAAQLGIRTYTGETALADFNRGVGVPTAVDPADDDLRITARDGTQFTVNLSTATTVQDAIDLINSAALGAGAAVTADLAATGNGIRLVDSSAAITVDLTVEALEGSQAAHYLGFVPDGATQISSSTGVLQSEDRHTLEADSLFNTLLRLRTALLDGDEEEIGRSVERLDEDFSRINFARAEFGTRLQNLEAIENQLKDEDVQLRSALSQEVDADIIEAISNLTARQYAFEASLRTTASILQVSLFDYI